MYATCRGQRLFGRPRFTVCVAHWNCPSSATSYEGGRSEPRVMVRWFMTAGLGEESAAEWAGLRMTSSVRDPWVDRVICADASQTLKEIPDRYYDAIVTSPPYYQQRDYGAKISFGRDLSSYVDWLLGIFTECARVTKDSGSIFWNLGD